MDPGPRPTNAEMAQLVAMLEDAGLVEVYTDEAARDAYRLTEDGVRVGNMLAMVDGEDAHSVLEALLPLDDDPEPSATVDAAPRIPWRSGT